MPTLLPPGSAGTPYQVQFPNTQENYTFSVTAGALPPGSPAFTLTPTGLLSGTPTVPGTYNFTITMTDTDGNPDPDPFVLPYTIVIS
jgi:hypothetical protein